MKNREQTESRILEAVASIVESEGFEKLGINTIASKANVSKMLIYRYFGGLEELIAQFIMQKDYWANTGTVIINPQSVGDSIKNYCCPIKPLHAAILSLNPAEMHMISSNFKFQAPLE